MKNWVHKMIEKAKESFPDSHVYKKNEFIVNTKNNIYFRIDNVESDLEFKCKMVEWVSRPAHKGLAPRCQKYIRAGLNKFLGTNFDHIEFGIIYTPLGNCVNRTLTKKFIESGYDIKILKP